MSEYLAINIFIIIVPLFLSFEKKVQYYRNFHLVLLSILLVSIPFIIWDSIAVMRKDWGFNDKFILGITFFNLPLEEILFFFNVPYSTIFIYESLSFYFQDKKLKVKKGYFLLISLLLLIAAVIFNDKYYTSTVSLFTAAFILTSVFFRFDIITSRLYWIFILITYIPFLLVNYVLTALPIVWYSEAAFLGYRLTTIPAEDFLYSYSLISFYLLFYLILKEKWHQKKLQ